MSKVKKCLILTLTLALTFILSSISVFAAGDTWSTKAPMSTARYGFQVAVLNGKIYVIGGQKDNSGSGYLQTVEEYDPETNTWTTKASMSFKSGEGPVAVVNGKIYVIGAYPGSRDTVGEYNPDTNTWKTKEPMKTARSSHQVAVVNGKIYAIGGYSANALNSVEEYNPETDTWITKAPMSTARYQHQVAVVNGKIYAIGGSNGSRNLNTVEEYNPETNTWTAKAQMSTEKYYHLVVALNGKIYVIDGGMATIEEYDPGTNTWATKKMSIARQFLQVVILNGKIYSVAGKGVNGVNKIEEYNPKTNTSTTKASMSTTRYFHQAAVVNGKIYAIGGYNGNGLNSVEEYTPGISAPAKLTASSGNSSIKLSWDAVSDATTYNIKRSTTPSGQYSTITTTSAITYTDNTVKNGTTYYYVISAVNESGESEDSNEVSATPTNPNVTLEVVSVDKAKVGDDFTANVVIHNAKNICAEDIKLAFDTSKLEFVSAEGTNGIKIFKEDSITEGIKRYITASLGKSNAANGDKVLLKLKFKAIAKGEAKIDITKGRIADNATLEMDVDQKNCGEKTILIEGTKDVNRSGEYTLLDLGIDAWYHGNEASATDTSKYDADQDGNGKIDDDDLTYIVNEMINNPNYFKMN